MPSVRYITNIAPVEHINGKMAPVSVIVSNSPDGHDLKVEGYWYGFRRNGSRRNRYGIRTIRRNLVTNPYTAQEEENRTLFTVSLNTVYANKDIPANWALCVNDWQQQREYSTVIGFAVHVVRANQGIWPDRWTP